ncbi:MAG: hypothetical protein M1272_02015, partial [Firmicutes bacterium]|nr:hypothetical protein [Bacillota bacterium]
LAKFSSRGVYGGVKRKVGAPIVVMPMVEPPFGKGLPYFSMVVTYCQVEPDLREADDDEPPFRVSLSPPHPLFGSVCNFMVKKRKMNPENPIPVRIFIVAVRIFIGHCAPILSTDTWRV